MGWLEDTKLWHYLEVWANVDGEEDGSYTSRATCKPNCDSKKGGPPLTTICFAIAYVVIFYCTDGIKPAHEILHGDHLSGVDFDSSSYTAEAIGFYPEMKGEIYRYWTYQFLHVDAVHLWMNVVLLLLAGIPLELVHDGYLVYAIHGIGLILGCMFHYWVGTTILVGASAGVYALIFTHISNFALNGDVFSPKYIFIHLLLNLPLIGLFLYDIIKAFIDEAGTTSYTSHLAGVFTGLTFGFAMLRNFFEQKWEKSVRRWLLITFIVVFLMMFLVQFHDFDIVYNIAAGGSDTDHPADSDDMAHG